jgi:ParB family chromosome partitioning protein
MPSPLPADPLQRDTAPDLKVPPAETPAQGLDSVQRFGAPELKLIELGDLRPDPNQPRKFFSEKELLDLAASIRSVGLIQPIAVRPSFAGTYTIVAGERRYRAYQWLAKTDPQFKTIPAIVQDRNDADSALAALIENVVREDLNPIERAEALKELKKRMNTTWEGVAERVGISVRHVHFLTGMLKLNADFRQALSDQTLTEKHARALRKLAGDPKGAWQLFEFLKAQPQISGDEALALAATMGKHPGTSPEAALALIAQGKIAAPKPRAAKVTPPSETADEAARGVAQALLGLTAFMDAAQAVVPTDLDLEQQAQLRLAAQQAQERLSSLLAALPLQRVER